MAGGGDEDAVAESTEHPLATEEWLASRVLQHVADAREVCRLAPLNRNFRAASFSDLVWQKRLPPQPFLDAIVDPLHRTQLSLRDLYMQLCKSVLYDDGLKRFWIDPSSSGGDCYMISARALSICWGDTPQYWKWKRWPGAMFREVAYLQMVCWFDIKGTFRQVLRPGKYMVSFRMQVKHREAGRCWDNSPIKLRLENTTYAHPPHLHQVFFNGSTAFKRRWCPSAHSLAVSETLSTSDSRLIMCTWSSEPDASFVEGHSTLAQKRKQRKFTPSKRSIGCELNVKPQKQKRITSEWVECDVGEFVVENENEGLPVEVQFSMQEIKVLGGSMGLF